MKNCTHNSVVALERILKNIWSYNMRANIVVLIAGMLLAGSANAAVNYTSVAADLSNISPNDASSVTNANDGSDNLWRQRDGLGEGNVTVLEAKPTEAPPTLTMTITGLHSSMNYEVYVNYIEFTNVGGDQGISASLDNATFYDFGAAGGTAGSPGFVELSGHTEADRVGYRGYIGTAVANGSGEIEFFANNSGVGGTYENQSWFDGGTVVAQGAIITVGSFDANGGGSGYTDGDVGGTFAVATNFDGNSTIYTFSDTADFDGGGTDDTFSFDFVYTMYSGSTILDGNVTLGTSVALVDPSNNSHFGQDYVGDASANVFVPGDSFTLSIANAVFTSGEGGETAIFTGFNSVKKYGTSLVGQDLYIGTTGYTTATVDAANASTVDLGGVLDLAVTTSITSGTAAERLRDLNFTFETQAIIPPKGTVIFIL